MKNKTAIFIGIKPFNWKFGKDKAKFVPNHTAGLFYFGPIYIGYQIKVPKRKRVFEIWAEGYATLEQYEGARLINIVRGETFADACEEHFKDHKYFNKQKLTVHGCRLFDNEADARKRFG